MITRYDFPIFAVALTAWFFWFKPELIIFAIWGAM